MNDQHPSHEVLVGLARGTLFEELADTVANHVEQCATCEILLGQIERSPDQITSMLREPADDAFLQLEKEQGCRRMVALVEQIAEPAVEPSVASTFTSGKFIGDYQIFAKLGAGGMGTVYRGLHTRLDKTVAIKVLPAARKSRPDSVARFEREMKAVGKLSHPNIVTAHDAGVADGVHYLVMEFVDGIDLSKLSRHAGQMSVGSACELVRQAAMGLHYIHQNSMVHRDIKPANLIVTRREPHVVKVLDLGLALLDEKSTTESAELTNSGQFVGTLAYVAPEQLDDSHTVDIRADIYSLGATLYKLLTGESPYGLKRDDSPLQLMKSILTRPAPSIASKRDDLPPALIQTIDRMLATNPAERIATPGEVADTMAAFASADELPELIESISIAGTDDIAQFNCETQASASTPVRITKEPWRRHSAILYGKNITIAVLIGTIVALASMLVNRPGTDPEPQDSEGIVVDEDEATNPKNEAELQRPKRDVPKIVAKERLPAQKPPKPATKEHAIVTRSLDVGARVTVQVGKTHQTILAKNELPDEPLQIIGAQFQKPDERISKSLAEITELGTLQSLGFEFPAVVSDADLKSLPSGKPSIGKMFIANGTMSDLAMKLISSQSNLQSLSLQVPHRSSEITDKGLTFLAELRDLRHIWLTASPKVTDDGLLSLGRLKNLSQLTLTNSGATGKGFYALAQNGSLTNLSIDWSPINDAGLEYIVKIQSLRNLSLVSTRISDRGVMQLRELKSLKSLDVRGTRLSYETIQTLRKELPGCFVRSDYVTIRDIQWILDLGGTVELFEGAQTWQIRQVSDWRPSRARINRVSFHGVNQLEDSRFLNIRHLPLFSRLDLSGTSVTNRAIGTLAQMRFLEDLTLRDSKISQWGVDQLDQLLQCRITQ